MARRMTLADEDEILRCAQDDTERELRLMPSGRPRRVPIDRARGRPYISALHIKGNKPIAVIVHSL